MKGKPFRSGSSRSETSDATVSLPLTPAPYHFVPVQAAAAVTGEPGYHHRLDLTGLWHGELLCTLTALTPLLAANDQYSWEEATSDVRRPFEQLLRERFRGNPPGSIANEKKFLEPLADGRRGAGLGPVLIAGAAVKGMIRQSLAALLSAPMERVAEHWASYRPNVKSLGAKHNPIRVAVPALVTGGGGWASAAQPHAVQLLVMRSLVGTLCYVHPDAVPHLPQRIRDLLDEPEETLSACYASKAGRQALLLSASEAAAIRGVGLSQANILKPNGPNPPARLEGWLPVVNRNGIDLAGALNRLFHEQNPELARELSTKSLGGYPLLFLELGGTREVEMNDAVLLRAFYRSLEHLAEKDKGHLRAHPLLTSEDSTQVAGRIEAFRQRGLQAGDILFLEESDDGKQKKITSLGHHFYYRWRYRTTVQRTAVGTDQAPHGQTLAPGLRDVLCPRELELKPDRPDQLSGARLLFGYVGSSEGKYSDTEPLTFGIGVNAKGQRTDFAQLAGRVSINMAVEQNAGRPPGERFLNERSGFLVPLRPLGLPRPSAVEHYLTQDRLDQRGDGGTLCTYGDTPDDAAVGRPRGRKFYLHQPDAAEPGKANCFELTDSRHPDWTAGTKYMLLIDQATVGRYVSRPGTQFRFALRFSGLRLWELGALLFTLQPTLDDVRTIHDSLPETVRGPLTNWLKKVADKGWNAEPERLLAHKLGHGRSLGLGSVIVGVDRLRRLSPDVARLVSYQDTQGDVLRGQRTEALKALVKYLADPKDGVLTKAGQVAVWVERCLVPWLQVHRYAGRTRFDYPRRSEKGVATIFNYHTALRSQHAEGRKRKKPTGIRPRQGLPELNDLDS